MPSNAQKYILCIAIALIINTLAMAQNDQTGVLGDIIEEIASTTDSELDYTGLLQSLEALYNDPINLNAASDDDLHKLIFLTEYQIYSLMKYRRRYGDYGSIYELQFVDGIDEQTLRLLLPFVKVEKANTKPKTSLKKAFKYGKHTVLARYQRVLQSKKGFAEIDDSILALRPNTSRYLGSPDKLYFRYGFKFKDKLSFGLTAEKDEGEQFFRGTQKYGFDFYSAHFQLNDVGIMRKLIVGDFSAQFGQGLTLCSGMSFGKTANVANVIKKPRGVSKYTSANESAFFRGEAVTLQFKNVSFTEFFSYKPLDGTLAASSDTAEQEDLITSFLESGYHRTPTEMGKRHTIHELLTGANVSWTTTKLKIGATGIYYRYSQPIGENSSLSKRFDFVGNNNVNVGIDYLLTLHKVNFFGETAISKNLGLSTLNGAVIDFVPEFKMSVVHRYYQPQYQGLYAQPFSEGNKPNNETGLFVGAQIFPIKRWKIETSFDSWKYPWLRYGVNAPSHGMEFLAQVTYTPMRSVEMYLRYKYENKTITDSDTEERIRPVTEYSTAKYRYRIVFMPDEAWNLKTCVEVSNYAKKDNSEWGFLVYQDVQYKLARVPLTLSLHFAAFDTKSYYTRIYAYEPDVLYGFSIPAYFYKGTRLTFVLKYTILKNLDIWFRIANTYYSDKQELGSGLDLIDGNNRTDVKLQVRYVF